MAASNRLVPPCTYQGGKQRLAREIVDAIDSWEGVLRDGSVFYDVCCGSGAVTLEFLNRGLAPGRVRMCDAGPWGTFWRSVGSGAFDVARFDAFLDAVPADKALVKGHVLALAGTDAGVDTEYKFLVLQAASFGGRQVWRDGPRWRHSSFRDYWTPTETSVRRSPCNPFQPRPEELRRRVAVIAAACRGVDCLEGDAGSLHVGPGAVVYVDPPYPGTTSYGYDFDVPSQVSRFLDEGASVVYVSMDRPLSDDAVRLSFGGPKGGVSGNRTGRWEEWLSAFRAST